MQGVNDATVLSVMVSRLNWTFKKSLVKTACIQYLPSLAKFVSLTCGI